MATLGYMGFTINVVGNVVSDTKDVLIWAGGGTEAVPMEKIIRDLDKILNQAEEFKVYKHWSEVWE